MANEIAEIKSLVQKQGETWGEFMRKNDELLRQVVRLYIEQHHRNQIDRLLGDM